MIQMVAERNPGSLNLAFAEEELLASVCRDSLFETLKEFWDVIIAEKLVLNWHIEVLCDELQTVAERVFAGKPKEYDLIINVPPGSTKSTIASVVFPAWVWTRMPTARMLCGSFADPLALYLSRRCRDIVMSDKYRKLFPEITLKVDQNAKSHFATTFGGERYCMGTGGTVTGLHGHFLIVDDPLNPQQSLSDVDLENANLWMDETLSQRKIDKALTPLILIMQRLHQNDPTAARLAKRKAGPVRLVCLPAEETEDIQPPHFRQRYTNGLLDPKRLSRRVLKEARAMLGPAGYACQMLQSPVPRGGAMFDVDKVSISRRPPERFRQVVRYWDKAGTSKGGAYTVGVKMGVDYEGRYWVLHVVRVQLNAARRELLIQQVAEIDGPTVQIGIEQEPGAAGLESAENTIRRLAGFRVVKDKPSGDKETRADTFATQVNAGNVFLKEGNWNDEYLEELRYFPRSRYKDQVDGSSGAFAMISKPRIRLGAL